MPEITKKSKTKKCSPEQALKKLLCNYEPEQLSFAFTDVEKMFKEWSCTDFADDKESRSNFVFALQILGDINDVIEGYPTNLLKSLRKQAQKEEVKQAS